MQLSPIFVFVCIICGIVADRVPISISDSAGGTFVKKNVQERQPYSQSFQLFWDGANSTCTNCSVFGGSLYSGSFACDYNSLGNWNGGSRSFLDSIPSGSVVTQVHLIVVGLFNCRYQPGGLSAFFQLNLGLLTEEAVALPVTPKGCLCPQCVVPQTVISQYNAAGIEFYNYGGSNSLSVIPVDNSTGMCLSYINVSLLYTPAAPTVGIYAPHGGPINGQTIVTFFGDGFSSDVRYYCMFSGVATNATVGNDGLLLSCLSPPMILGTVNLTIKIAISGDEVPVGTFEYYEEPRIDFVTPSVAPCDGRNVTVVGAGFFDLDKAFKCTWSTSQPNLFGGVINSTAVWCATPEGASGTQTLQVSLNGQQYAKNITFVCSAAPTPTPPHTPFKFPGWAWVVIIFGGATLLVVAILSLSRRCTKKNEDFEDSLSRSSLLNPVDGTPNIFVKKIEMSDIKLFQKIGKGTFGEVFKGVWNGTDVAVKFLTSPNMNEQFLQDFYKEVLIMRSLRHPNVLQFLGACTSPPDIFIVMEYMPMGSLYKILHDEGVSLYLDLLKRMIMDAAKGMNYLHKSDPVIIHRDLKSHNLLVDENWKVKVCDFGLSKILETQSDFNQMTACGTPSWTAPEILRNEKYTEKADVYSFGIVLWECMSREDPYYGMPPFQVVLAVGTKGMRPTIPSITSTNWALLIQDCWAEQPSQRPSFDEVITRIEYLEGGKQQIVRP